MATAAQLKKTIRARWNLPERVDNWINSGLNVDFHDAACRKSWLAALKKAAGGGKGRSALDIGTGPGTIAQLWAELGYQVKGVDFSPGMVTAARAVAAEKHLAIEFLEGDAEKPPFTDQSFDVISSRFVLFTLPHPGYAVRRWVELLRPGGAIVLIGHSRSDQPGPPRQQKPVLTNPVDQRHQEALRELPFMNHTVNDLQVLLEAVGLRDIHRMPMDQIIATRTAIAEKIGPANVNMSPPFIIVGYK